MCILPSQYNDPKELLSVQTFGTILTPYAGVGDKADSDKTPQLVDPNHLLTEVQ